MVLTDNELRLLDDTGVRPVPGGGSDVLDSRFSTAEGRELRVAPAMFYPTYDCKSRYIVHQGGQWSGKTVNILIVLFCHCVEQQGIKVTVASGTLPHMKSGVISDMERFVYPYFQPWVKQYHKTDYVIKFSNGSEIEFKAYDDQFKASGPKRQYLYVNEAPTMDWATFQQLDSRTDIQTIIDYNPAAPFWCHEKIIGRYNTTLFISDHRHNPFLSAEKHAEIEGNTDDDWFRVYGRGLTGNLKGSVYPGWERIPDSEYPHRRHLDTMTGGLDYGYTNDPTAGVVLAQMRDAFFLDQVCYTPGLSAYDIMALFVDRGLLPGEDPVFADHDKFMNAKLRRIGMIGIRNAKKNLLPGILFMRSKKVYYTERSHNLHDERLKYVFLENQSTGKIGNMPSEKDNHLMDASRYAGFSRYGGVM